MLAHSASRRTVLSGLAATAGLFAPQVGRIQGQALASRFQTGSSGPRTLRIWANSFVPGSMPGLTVPAPGTVWPQPATMIPATISGTQRWTLTHQRSFSPDITAMSLVHSAVEIDLTARTRARWRHRRDPVVVIDATSAAELCRLPVGEEDPGPLLGGPPISPDGRTLSVGLSLAVRDACLTGASVVRYGGTITIEGQAGDETVRVGFDGQIAPFLAFELYAAIDNGAPTPILQVDAPPGSGPADLLFAPPRPLAGSAELIAGCGACDTGMCCRDLTGAVRCVADSFDLILSGGPSPTDSINVDDDFSVVLSAAPGPSARLRINRPLFADTDQLASALPPISFQARNGDELTIVASDAGGCRALDPLYLHRPHDDAVQVLSPTGVAPDCVDRPPGEFFDETFRIALPCPRP